MFDELLTLASNENITGNNVLKILKEYSSTISVFDMMDFTSHIIEENKYVQESFREDSQKSYIESFLLRIKDILNDNNDYGKTIDCDAFLDAVGNLKTHYEIGISNNANSKGLLIFEISSLYSTFILEEPIHPVGTPFPGSLKVEEKNNEFLCPVKDANIDTPNAVCNICLAKQLEF